MRWYSSSQDGYSVGLHAVPGASYCLFEVVPLLQGQRVSLGNDGDDVDHLTEAPHELHIQRPEAVGGQRGQLVYE